MLLLAARTADELLPRINGSCLCAVENRGSHSHVDAVYTFEVFHKHICMCALDDDAKIIHEVKGVVSTTIRVQIR